MKSIRQFVTDARRHKGLALIIVLSMLALSTIVMLAFLSVADTEHKGTVTYSASQTARRLADTAVNIVVSQIQAGTEQDTPIALSGRETHATQPGAVRKYSDQGAFLAGYKLFSDSAMIFQSTGSANGTGSITDEREFLATSEPPAGWNQGNNLLRYVDINEPAIKGVIGETGTAVSAQVYFPVLDPRAAFDMDPATGLPTPAEGFTYETTTALTGTDIGGAPDTTGASADVNAITKPNASSNPDSLRLAMPVQWLYLLKDGTMGTLDANLKFQSSGISVPSEETPIIGRIAFWTDDETCKININTASEPTFLGQPTYYHERDHRWADYPAARGEYQRFPGHPATVALSSVLYPNPLQSSQRNLDTYGTTDGSAAQTSKLSVKNLIYDIVPRIARGGSNAGTTLFAADDFNSGGNQGLMTSVDLSNAINERLYSSVDELFFSELSTDGIRVPTVTSITGGQLFNKQTLERASGFLTAHSRASEISNLGLPRIAMWPVHKEASKRTPFDNLIAYCSNLGQTAFTNLNLDTANIYIFQRQKALDQSNDVKIARNAKLLNMLDTILENARFPATAATGGPGDTFKRKMGSAGGFENYRQVIVEMFDYIRSTNLRDSYLVPVNRNSWRSIPVYWGDDSTRLTQRNIYDERDSLEGTFNTFTTGVVRNTGAPNNPFNDVSLPGHGQVTPSIWTKGNNYRGFGRSISISEIGLQFICTADGQPDMYSWRHLDYDPDSKKYKIKEIPKLPARAVDNTDQFDTVTLDSFAADGTVSGGRTALKVDENKLLSEDTDGGFAVDHTNEIIRDIGPVSNTGAQEWNDGSRPAEQFIKDRYYSNFPPLSDVSVAESLYSLEGGIETAQNKGKHRNHHPGTLEKNWNYSLDVDTPLQINEKRIQALFHLEFFCPSVGYTGITPEFTIVLSGNELSSIETNGETLFKGTNDKIIKSARPIYQVDGAPEVGGYVSFRRVAGSRGLPARGGVPADKMYYEGASSSPHIGIMNLDLVSDFFTVRSDQPLIFRSGPRPIKIAIYDSHNYLNREPIQVVYFKLDEGTAPVPDLIVQPSKKVRWIRQSDSAEFIHPAVQAPHWWSFHQDGVLGRALQNPVWIGRFADTNAGVWQGRYGTRVGVDGDTARDGGDNVRYRQSLPGSRALIYGRGTEGGNYGDVKRMDNAETGLAEVRAIRAAYTPGNNYNTLLKHYGSDVVRSILPSHGDSRLLAAKAVVKETDWSLHPLYKDPRAFLAHNFSSYNAGSEPGFDRSGNSSVQNEDATRRLLPQTVAVSANLVPDAPYSGGNNTNINETTGGLSPAFLAQRYYDFDESDPGGRVGAYINKPDEGNYAVGDFQASGWPAAREWRATYFRSDSFGARFAPGASSFFTPNRMVSSPVMMGSLPSRVFYSNATGPDASSNGNGAWTNLLFRPHVQVQGAQTSHPGAVTPADHYLLDLFWMPVVEPYAISEPLSTAGKVNMNYQIMPFTHIRRATAMHAVMKSEMFAALPNADHSAARGVRRGFGPQGTTPPLFRDENAKDGDRAARWHRYIAIDRLNNENGTADNPWWNLAAAQRVQATLRQFEERFNFTTTANGNGASGLGGAMNLPGNFRGGLFRSASQICEMHLIPSRVLTSGGRTGTAPVPSVSENTENVKASDLSTAAGRETAMRNFWTNHSSTGDNTRERPYANLYAKLTTRSNTFRVHVRAQAIKAALRRNPDSQGDFNTADDEIMGEFRGSFLLERYIDLADLQNAGGLADFADGKNPLDDVSHPPLDSYYRFRVLESKRFAP